MLPMLGLFKLPHFLYTIWINYEASAPFIEEEALFLQHVAF
jgi:hypothetical protein